MTEFVERKSQLSGISIHGFQRDTHGEKLFINFSLKQGDEEKYQTAIVTTDGFKVIDSAPMVFYNDLGEPVARLNGVRGRYEADGRLFYRYENSYYVLGNGARIPSDTITGIINITGSDCVLVRLKSAWMILGLANQKEAIFDHPPEFDVPECANLCDGRLVIFGRSKLPKDHYGIDCLVYDETPHGYRLAEEIPLPWANWAYDFDCGSGKAIIGGRAQMFAGYYLFDIRSKHRVWLGFIPSDNNLFLRPDLVRALK